MTPAYAVHNIEGRTRIHVPSKRNDEAWFNAAAERIRHFGNVEYVSVNPLTASILILHQTTLGVLAAAAQASNLFDVVETPRTLPSIIGQASAKLRIADDRVHHATHGSLDLYSLMAFGMAGLGLFQMLKKRTAPPAMTLLWYAYEMARHAHHKVEQH